ncbi:hypothetical protein SDC9_82143 [bioreactor metagenome]|uniref:Helix-turn-helix domain-containing protein n=1 Tax=bioreactor metagenome TaxID=1076179 RepID=A0A644Z3T6_9ZZZZ
MGINMTEFYTVEELAALLRVQPHTVRQWTYQKRVPYIKLQGTKGHVLYMKSAIEKWLQDNTMPTMQELRHGTQV